MMNDSLLLFGAVWVGNLVPRDEARRDLWGCLGAYCHPGSLLVVLWLDQLEVEVVVVER